MTNFDLDNLTIKLAHYILENNSTIRATGKYFSIPKSTVHYLLNKNLKITNYYLYQDVKKLLTNNFETKHIRGGEATKKKYKELKNEININDAIEFNI